MNIEDEFNSELIEAEDEVISEAKSRGKKSKSTKRESSDTASTTAVSNITSKKNSTSESDNASKKSSTSESKTSSTTAVSNITSKTLSTTTSSTSSTTSNDEETLCDICLESKCDYICENCQYKYCWNCLYKCITQTTQIETMCQNCERVLSVSVIWKCFGKSKFRKEYMKSLHENELEQYRQQLPIILPYCKKFKENIYNSEDESVNKTFQNNMSDICKIINSINELLYRKQHRFRLIKLNDVYLLDPYKVQLLADGVENVYPIMRLSPQVPRDLTWIQLYENEIRDRAISIGADSDKIFSIADLCM